MGKTFRRDKLKRLCEKGKLVLVSSYHFDDMYGTDRTTKEMPVALMPDNRNECQQGICYLFESDFNSSVGHASLNEDGTRVWLYVHSNCNYTFRILP